MKVCSLLALVTIVYAEYTERECPCTVANIWLDVVAVLDNSKGTATEMYQELATIGRTFAALNISQEGGQTTRLGMVTYNSEATVQYNMSYFTSTDQMMNDIWSIPATKEPIPIIKVGLSAAADLLQSGRTGGKRQNVKQAIILFASAYDERPENDPRPVASVIKSFGISIITFAMNFQDTHLVEKLRLIATPGMAFDFTTNYGDVQSALCKVNCFCPSRWRQLTDDYNQPSEKFGECLLLEEVAADWTTARESCRNVLEGAYLASELSPEKHKFNSDMAKSACSMPSPVSYHIGLKYNAELASWAWEQAKGMPVVPIGNYTAWNAGFPSSSYDASQCVKNEEDTGSFKIGWQNDPCVDKKRYLCQAVTCDTDNYCP